MAEHQMETINVEDIMQEIRAQIEHRGYKKSDLRFADVTIETVDNMEDIDEYFELQNFGLTVDKMNSKRTVQCWRMLCGNKFVVLMRKIIRKLIKFYVEPIVKEQNQFNFYTTSAMAQLYAKLEKEQAMELELLQNRIEELENKCRALGEKCGE